MPSQSAATKRPRSSRAFRSCARSGSSTRSAASSRASRASSRRRASAFGRYLVAIGGNEAAARLAGINVQRTKLTVYVVSGLLAGLAGLIETARLSTADPTNVGGAMELDAIAAVVVGGNSLGGGRASIGGTIVGALIMAVITTSFNMLRLPYAWSLVATGGIILIAVYIQRPRVA